MLALCPSDVGIILTYRCPNGCSHCIYNCDPHWDHAAMSAGDLMQALEAVRVWPQTPQVHFTGGEPFLHVELLLEGVRMAARLGIPRYLETSAGWCTSEALAEEHFTALREAGLQAVLISCSPFHAERIPPARTRLAARVATRVFGAERVMVYQSEFLDIMEHMDAQNHVPLSRYVEKYGVEAAGRMLWDGYGLIAGGRSGYHLGGLITKRTPDAFAGLTCAGEILYAPHSHFDLYGHFVPAFCGGLSLGDWRALPQLLADYQAGRYPSLIGLLISDGPYGLFNLAREAYGYRPLVDGYAGKCHLCVDVRRHLAGVGDFPALQPAEFYDHIGENSA
jgi:organic radical activating enzyme